MSRLVAEPSRTCYHTVKGLFGWYYNLANLLWKYTIAEPYVLLTLRPCLLDYGGKVK
jgi:hypothetical protein